jgi:hypothetical protein
MKRLAAILVALTVLVVSGLVHGFWSERWTASTALHDAAARVANVPLEIGDWQAQAIDVDAGPFLQAGAQGFWTRSYVNKRNKTTMLVILMCGRAGRMAVHTPEVCYRGAGYEMERAPETLPVTSASGENLGTFWTAGFSKEAGGGSSLRLYWSWNAQDTWQASAKPRWDFGGEPFIYKLYVSHDAPGSTGVAKVAALGFMQQLLPELHKALFDRDNR